MTNQKRLNKVLFDIIYSLPFELFIICCIIASLTLLVIDTTTNNPASTQLWIDRFEWSLNSFFVLEYGTRLILAPSKSFFFRKNLIDLLALLPILRFFRLLRIIRLLRILKFVKSDRWQQALAYGQTNGKPVDREHTLEISMVGLGLLAIILMGSIGILMAEHQHNDQFKTFIDGVWWSVVTLTTVGYGDKFPVTLGGRLLAIIVMILGLSFFALMTGWISSFIIERYKKEENKGMDIVGMKKHIIICGWNDNAPTIIKELLGLYQNELKHLVVIADEKPDLPLVEHIHFVAGDFTKREILERAELEHAESVLVLADNSGGRNAQDMDARTILASLAIEKLHPHIYTCVEIISPDNIEHLQNIEVDEYILAANYTGNLLAHSVKNHGLSRVYHELLRCKEGNQIYKLPLPTNWSKLKFEECAVEILQKHQGILIGLERQDQYHINPENKILQYQDTLVYIAKSPIELTGHKN